MNTDRNELVAKKAFELWEKSGRPDGRDTEFWHHAEIWMEDQDMSVQVRRRRETAAFLSSYVGAQGELLVDTTNNRVQVHDGATAGGWPAAGIGDLPGRSAAINGNFAVNQRAYASGTALAAGAYAHDRWKAGGGGCTYTYSQVSPDTSVTITGGSIVQAVDVGNVYATAYWLTWTGTAKARVWQGSPSGSFVSGASVTVGGIVANALLVTGLTLGTITSLEFGTGTLGLVQFEAALPNAGPTRFERRHNEIAICQRYYQTSYNPGLPAGTAQGNGGCTVNLNAPGGGAIGDFVLPVQMRVAPTATVYDGTGAGGKVSYYSVGSSNYGWQGGATPTVVYPHPGRFFVQTNITNSVQVNFDYTLSAEL